MLTWCHSLSMPAGNALSLEIHKSWVFAICIRSSAQRSSYGTPVWISRESASSAWMKRSALRTELQCTPTPMQNSSLYWPMNHTRLGALESMLGWHTAHSSPTRLLKTHHRTFRGSQSMAFSRLTKGKLNSLLVAMHFYKYRTMKMELHIANVYHLVDV